MIRVLVVDDHSLVRVGLAALLRAAEGIEVVGEAANGREAIEQAAELRPDVVLMDVAMPELDGLAATRELVACQPDVRVIMLTTFAAPDQVSGALAAGARGYLVKDVAPTELVQGIRSVVEGGAPLSPTVAATVLDGRLAAEPVRLSEREKQILRLLVSGCSNKQIARELGISEKTVKTHFGRIFQRIGVRDRTQAALWASKHLGAQSDTSA